MTMHLLGYSMALITGLSLGLMGSGGSILTVPVLVYLFRMNPVMATSYSLFVVGATSLVGLSMRLRGGHIDARATLAFAAPSLAAVFLVRKYVVHGLPPILDLPWGQVSRDYLIMVFFSVVMLAAAISMLLKSRSRGDGNAPSPESAATRINIPMIGFEGALVGFVTGLVGAGGGFLIVPVMILLGHLSFETAIGTSLAIITAQSLVGFLTDVSLLENIRWGFLALFSVLSVAGVLTGSVMGKYMRPEGMKRVFGWFTLVIALLSLGREIFTGGI